MVIVETCLLFTVMAAAAATEAASPTVLWASSPTAPGETVMLAVAGFSNISTVQLAQGGGAWTDGVVVGATEYGCGVEVPPSFAPGEFQVKVGNGASIGSAHQRPDGH
jgi:hypothetical protein